MSLSKIRKVDKECRVFNEKWSTEYFVIENKNSALCLICNKTVSVLKEYNIRRHFESKHSKSKFAELTGNARSEKLAFLKKSVTHQRDIFTKQKNKNEAAVRASFKISHILAKAGKPFTDGELIKNCIDKAAEELCPKEQQVFNSISLSANTVARRTEDIGDNIMDQFRSTSKNFEYFSIALDESTDVSDSAQVLLFIRGVSKDLEVTEELVDVYSMESNVTGIAIFNKVIGTLANLNLDLSKLKGITTDGGKNMCGSKTGLVGYLCNAVESAGGERPMVVHCIIHQQALCSKNLNVSEVMQVFVKTVNYMRSHALKHRQFKNFLTEIDSQYPDMPYHCEVRWLSRGKVLERFFELHSVIDIFMTEQGKPVAELSDDHWLWKLAFAVDLVNHLNLLNLKLQGEKSFVNDLFHHVKVFRRKLVLFESQLQKQDLSHFETCKKFLNQSKVPFPLNYGIETIGYLREEFLRRFIDFDDDAVGQKISLFHNLFKADIERMPSELQLELTSSDNLMDYYKECYQKADLLPFYRSLSDELRGIKNFASGVASVFGSTYICEQTFSKMKYVKSKYRCALSDVHLKAILMIGVTHFEPQWGQIMETMQLHSSHSSAK